VIFGEAKATATPMGDTLRFAGTLELAGLDFSINERRVRAILRAARSYLPGIKEYDLVRTWRGLRPCTPDGLPIIARAKTVENLIVAGGHGTVGVSLGPITGKLVSQLAAGEEPKIPLELLALDRF
jgi:D-amino-acid dehydrogenase